MVTEDFREKYQDKLVEQTDEYLTYELDYSEREEFLKELSKRFVQAGVEIQKLDERITVYPESERLDRHYNKYEPLTTHLYIDFEPNEEATADDFSNKEAYVENVVSDREEIRTEDLPDDIEFPDPPEDESDGSDLLSYEEFAEMEYENEIKYIIMEGGLLAELIERDYKNRLNPYYEGDGDSHKLENYLNHKVGINFRHRLEIPTIEEQLEENGELLDDVDKVFGDLVKNEENIENIAFSDSTGTSSDGVDRYDFTRMLLKFDSKSHAEEFRSEVRNRRSSEYSSYMYEDSGDWIVAIELAYRTDYVAEYSEEDNTVNSFDYPVIKKDGDEIPFDRLEICDGYESYLRHSTDKHWSLYKDGVHVGNFDMRGLSDEDAMYLLDEYGGED